MISGSSVLSALFLYTIAAIVIGILHVSGRFLGKGGLTVLLFASALLAARLLLPFEISKTYVIRSWDFLGSIQIYLRENPAVPRGFVAIWITVAVIITGRDILIFALSHSEFKLYRSVDDKRVQQIAEEIGVSCPVRVSPDVNSVLVTGVLQPIIYFPEAPDLSDEIVRMALMHEEQHVRGHDALIKLFFGILSAVVWWTVWFRIVIDALLEIWCDKRVTAHMSEKETREYMDMLTEMAKRAVSNKKKPALALDEFSAAGRGDFEIKLRFRVMNAHAKAGSLSRYVSAAVMCVLPVLFLASYLVVWQPASEPPMETFEKAPEVYYHENYDGLEIEDEFLENDASRTFILKTADGRYELFVDYRLIGYLKKDEISSDKYQHLLVFKEAVHE